MTTVHYVDTKNGNDASAGTSWATAWKTTTPLKSLYTGVSITDVEVRFAKTTPQAISVTSSVYNTDRDKWAATPAKAIGLLTPSFTGIASGYPSSYGVFGWILAGSTGGDTRNTPESVGRLYLNTTPGLTPVKQVYRATGAIALSGYYAVEFWAAAHYGALTENLAVYLNLCSDTIGDVPVASYLLNMPDSGSYPVPMNIFPFQLGAGALPNITINSISISVVNPNPYAVSFWFGIPALVADPDTAGYLGSRACYIPTTVNSKVRRISAISNTGVPIVDGFEYARGVKNYNAYPMYESELVSAVMPNLTSAGVVGLPFKLTGGWNTVTSLVDGITCVDSAQLRVLPKTVVAATVEVANFAVLWCGRLGSSYIGGGYTGVLGGSASVVMTNCVATNLHIPTGGPECPSPSELSSYGTLLRGTVISASVSDCNITTQDPFYGQITGGVGCYSFNNCLFWDAVPSVGTASGSAIVTNCTQFNTATHSPVSTSVRPFINYSTYVNCKTYSIMSLGGSSTSNYTTYSLCEFYGNCAAPTGKNNTFSQSKFIHTAPSQYSFGPNSSTEGTIVSNTVIINSAQFTPTSYYSGGGLIYKGSGTLHIKDSWVTCNFDSVIKNPLALNWEFSNTTLELWGNGGSTAILVSATSSYMSLGIINGLYLYGTWAYGVVNPVHHMLVNGMSAASATTIPIDATGSGARPIFSSRASVNISGVTATGTTRVKLPTLASGPSKPVIVHSGQDQGIYTDTFSLVRDYSNSYSGEFSWKFTQLCAAGTHVFNEHQLGSVYVEAGVPVVVKMYSRRSSALSRGWLVIRPLFTVSVDHSDICAFTTGALSIWELLVINFTPEVSGSIELYASSTGVSGVSTWFDDLQITQR